MREILFRGQKICHPWNSDYLEWQYGDLMTNEDDYPQIYSHDGTCAKVFMETVGQFTGLTDKNGKRIFEGDVVNIHYFIGAFDNGDDATGIIKIDGLGIFVIIIKPFKGQGDYLNRYMYDYESKYIEVIGNIYDNPELSEAGI